VTRVVVTIPVDFPAFLAHLSIESSLEVSEVLQSVARPSTPIALILAFTPVLKYNSLMNEKNIAALVLK
jgi:hypothetical protein